MTTAQADPLIGRLVDGRYRVRARIARGGMATVYVATDLRLERRIALKVMHGHLSDDSVFQSRFIQEARAAARLADPHVVNVFDQGQDGELAYLVMEYLPGITLRELLREQRRLSVPQTITIMDAVLSGLAAAHRAGIVHRDVKPENVLLAEDGRIKIGDFGLARATTANTASGAQLLGTIAYLAPELVTRGTADARSDIYALGIMLYEMLVGEQPYKGEQPMQIAFQHATEQVPRPSVRNPGVPEQLDELVLWATEKEPDERPLDAQRMLDRLREIERELDVRPQPTAPMVTAPTAVIADTGGLTKILPGTNPTGPTEPATAAHPLDNATLLRRRVSHRNARGTLLMALVLLLAVVAGGAGWWFGSGPGSLVPVPSVAGESYDDAAKTLTADGFVPIRAEHDDIDVEAGLVIGTDPGMGKRLDKGAKVTVIVSTGPAAHDLPALAGLSQADARKLLTDARVTVADEVEEYFDDTPRDQVFQVRVTPRVGDVLGCADGCTVHEGDQATLQVSLGEVPDVSGQSLGNAKKTLTQAGLVVSDEVPYEFNDDVAEGDVIRQSAEPEGGGLWRRGDVIQLTVSNGPQLFAVPDVTGLTRDAAAGQLRDAGFEPDWNVLWSAFPDEFTEVTGTDPGEGSMRRAGSKVTLQIRSRAF
ncbi:MAG: Stk1 family PASTA domain-containing Ser/Thr kinase [Microbacterium sp.]